jgi:hypothetical protein
MEAKLNVEIGAEIQKLNTGFAQAIKTVESGASKIDSDVKRVERSFTVLNNTKFTFGSNFQTASSKLAADAARTSSVLGGSLVKGSNSAAFALTNLGRVAQDAPFGFIGIQNNLNPLLESFARLKAETGSTGAALKALGSSLIGPAGLGIALSVVSAAFLFYQQYVRSTKNATEEIVDVNKEFISSLTQVQQAQLKGSQNAVAELTTLKLLYAQTQDVTVSLKQRIDAVDQLQQKYPSYFNNVKDEVILAGNAKDAYIALSKAILATARARAAEELIAENTKQQLVNEQKIKDLEKQGLTVARELRKEKELEAAIVAAGGSESEGALNVEKRRNEISIEIAKNKIANNALEAKNSELVKSVNIEIENGARLTGGLGDEIKKNVEKTEKLKQVTQEWLDLMFAKGRDKAVSGLSTDSGLSSNSLLGDITAKSQAAGLAKLQKDTKQYLEHVDDFSKNVTAIINNGIVEGLSGVGESLGSALASGENVLEAFGNSVLSTVGSVLVQFGKMTIAAGVASLALKSALKLGNPFAAIAAGTALVAIGSLVRGLSSGSNSSQEGSDRPRKIPGFANGVRDFSGGIAVVGERGPELVSLPTGSSVIPNHNLSSFGGGDITFNVSSRIDQLGNLITAIDRERSRLRRVGA